VGEINFAYNLFVRLHFLCENQRRTGTVLSAVSLSLFEYYDSGLFGQNFTADLN